MFIIYLCFHSLLCFRRFPVPAVGGLAGSGCVAERVGFGGCGGREAVRSQGLCAVAVSRSDLEGFCVWFWRLV